MVGAQVIISVHGRGELKPFGLGGGLLLHGGAMAVAEAQDVASVCDGIFEQGGEDALIEIIVRVKEKDVFTTGMSQSQVACSTQSLVGLAQPDGTLVVLVMGLCLLGRILRTVVDEDNFVFVAWYLQIEYIGQAAEEVFVLYIIIRYDDGEFHVWSLLCRFVITYPPAAIEKAVYAQPE